MKTVNDKIKGNWNLIKGNLKQKWVNLTDVEFLYEEGKEDEVIDRIQKRTGEAKEAINNFIDKMKFE